MKTIREKVLEQIALQEEIAVVTGYIMYYDLLEFKINGSFFSKIDKAMELADKFIQKYDKEHRENWAELDWEETLNEFITDCEETLND